MTVKSTVAPSHALWFAGAASVVVVAASCYSVDPNFDSDFTPDAGSSSSSGGSHKPVVISAAPTTTSTQPPADVTLTPNEEAGAGAALSCNGDVYEPNNTPDQAWGSSTPLSACDPGLSINSVSSGSGDDDWFYFKGVDTDSLDTEKVCIPEPAIQITDPRFRLCATVQCGDGTSPLTDASDCGAGFLATAGVCCIDGGIKMVMKIDCKNANSAAQIWMGVKSTTQACIAYQIDYNF